MSVLGSQVFGQALMESCDFYTQLYLTVKALGTLWSNKFPLYFLADREKDDYLTHKKMCANVSPTQEKTWSLD